MPRLPRRFPLRSLPLAAAALLALAASAGATTNASTHARPVAHAAIIGGTTAPDGTWPWVAYIQAQTGSDGSGFACTGTVVSPNVILTAGHCAVDEGTGVTVPAADYTVVTGAHNLNDISGGQVLSVSRVLPAPTFNLSTLHDDASLLVLSSPTSAPAIPLAGSADSALTATGTSVAIAGWGLTNGNDQTSAPAQLQQASTAIATDRTCTRPYGSGYDATTMVCGSDPTSPRHVSTCNGDSGGPLLARDSSGTWTEAGLTSWGAAGCSPSSPSVFTRISHVSTWIQQQIAANAANAGTTTTPPPTTPTPGTPGTSSTPPATTLPPVITPATSTTPASVTPAPPVKVTPPAAARVLDRPGLYRGTAHGGKAIALRVATGGKLLTGLRFGVVLRCSAGGRESATVTAASPKARWAISTAHAVASFDRSVRPSRGVAAHVRGRFTSATRISGVLRVTLTSARLGRCDSGSLAFSATLR